MLAWLVRKLRGRFVNKTTSTGFLVDMLTSPLPAALSSLSGLQPSTLAWFASLVVTVNCRYVRYPIASDYDQPEHKD